MGTEPSVRPSDAVTEPAVDEAEDLAAFAQRVLSSLQPGVLFDGRFSVERIIGIGGMGCVISAHHVELDQRVAIKVLQPSSEPDERRGQRLVREARAAAKIKSEHVVRIFDVVSSGSFAPYIVMEYLEGESLAKRISRKRLDVAEAVDYVVQACEAVGEGHHLGIIHRDVKPANLFVMDRPARKLKVLDFGISRTGHASEERITESNGLLGSPAYASPEQLRSAREVDHRTDIWSLGVVLYQCLTGVLPFPGKSLLDVYEQILHGAPIPLRNYRPDLPREIESVILRCMEKDVTKRLDSVPSLVGLLREFSPDSSGECLEYLGALGVSVRKTSDAPESSPVPSGATLTAAASEIGRVIPSSKRGGSRIWLALLPALGLIGAGAWLWLRVGEKRPELVEAPHAASEFKPSPAPPSTQPGDQDELRPLKPPPAPIEETAGPPRAGSAAVAPPQVPRAKPKAPPRPLGAPAASSPAPASPGQRPPWVETR